MKTDRLSQARFQKRLGSTLALGMMLALVAELSAQTTIGSGLGGTESVTLAWDANSEPDLAGYNLYYGVAGTGELSRVDVGNVTIVTLTGVVGGTTYNFHVTAYNTSGLESDPSNVVGETINYPLEAQDDSMNGTLNTTTRIDPAFLLRNDMDMDGDIPAMLSVSADASVVGSTVEFVEGMIYYTPPTDFTGTDTFSYTATDGKGSSSTATVTMKVEEPVKPARLSSSVEPQPDGTVLVKFKAVPLVSYAVEVSSDLITWSSVGMVTAQGDGTVEYVDAGAGTLRSRFYRITLP